MTAEEPWWASGAGPDDGLDGSQDPFDAHRGARRGDGEPSGADTSPPAGDGDGDGDGLGDGQAGRLAADAIDLVGRLAAEAGRRIHARATTNASSPPDGAFTRPDAPVGPHAEGEMCDACPVCLGLRALRQARPDVVTHLADAAHSVTLALRALADTPAGDDTGGFEKIDLDQ